MNKLELIKNKTLNYLTKQDYDAIEVTEEGFVLRGTLIHRLEGLLDLKDEVIVENVDVRKIYSVEVTDLPKEKLEEIQEKFKNVELWETAKEEIQIEEIQHQTFEPEENNTDVVDVINDKVNDSFDKEFGIEKPDTQPARTFKKRKTKK